MKSGNRSGAKYKDGDADPGRYRPGTVRIAIMLSWITGILFIGIGSWETLMHEEVHGLMSSRFTLQFNKMTLTGPGIIGLGAFLLFLSWFTGREWTKDKTRSLKKRFF